MSSKLSYEYTCTLRRQRQKSCSWGRQTIVHVIKLLLALPEKLGSKSIEMGDFEDGGSIWVRTQNFTSPPTCWSHKTIALVWHMISVYRLKDLSFCYHPCRRLTCKLTLWRTISIGLVDAEIHIFKYIDIWIRELYTMIGTKAVVATKRRRSNAQT